MSWKTVDQKRWAKMRVRQRVHTRSPTITEQHIYLSILVASNRLQLYSECTSITYTGIEVRNLWLSQSLSLHSHQIVLIFNTFSVKNISEHVLLYFSITALSICLIPFVILSFSSRLCCCFFLLSYFLDVRIYDKTPMLIFVLVFIKRRSFERPVKCITKNVWIALLLLFACIKHRMGKWNGRKKTCKQ